MTPIWTYLLCLYDRDPLLSFHCQGQQLAGIFAKSQQQQQWEFQFYRRGAALEGETSSADKGPESSFPEDDPHFRIMHTSRGGRGHKWTANSEA